MPFKMIRILEDNSVETFYVDTIEEKAAIDKERSLFRTLNNMTIETEEQKKIAKNIYKKLTDIRKILLSMQTT